MTCKNSTSFSLNRTRSRISCSSFLLSLRLSFLPPSPSFYSVRNMAFPYCDSSQMAVAEPHRWSYLRRTPPSAPRRWFSPPPMFQTRGPSLNPIRTSSQDGVSALRAVSKKRSGHTCTMRLEGRGGFCSRYELPTKGVTAKGPVRVQEACSECGV